MKRLFDFSVSVILTVLLEKLIRAHLEAKLPDWRKRVEMEAYAIKARI